MAVPASTGNLVTTLTGMQVGDYIVCNYTATTSGTVGTFSNFGGTAAIEIPTSGTATPDGTFYFIKADTGLLISDRPIQSNITWDALNTAKLIQGKPTTFGGTAGVLRSLTGGVVHIDASGNPTATDGGLGGWPANNEWDKYIVNSTLDGKITKGDNNVWNWVGRSWVQETSTVALGAATNRVLRGDTTLTNVKKFTGLSSNSSNIAYRFRPVFEYKEV